MELKRGVNIGGYLSQCNHQKEHYVRFFGEEDVRRIRDWGMDHFRLPFDYSVVQDEDGEAIPEGVELLRRNVLWGQKYGLNIILDLHKASGYDFNFAGDNARNNLFTSEELARKFLSLWTLIAEEFGTCGNVVFELLNEVVETENADAWNALIQRAVAVIREIAPETPIIYGGIKWNSADTLKLLNPPVSDNIIYTFHFYEPLLFTHQKAHWVPNISMEDVHYPGTMEYFKALSEALGIQGSAVMMSDAASMGPDFIRGMVDEAVTAARAAGVPLYCGEFGVIDRAPLPDTVRWFADAVSVFRENDIAHAMWTYKEKDFGLIGEHYAPILEDLLAILTGK
ncbi:MAG: glycoside hydrolase family 5 protein [Clostridiaceae bacterium]|jgi:aryl-phospho-beta-D-glucosidase BglC (GH1 family)|nr:glycoside hydrolase family 5 protein [Oscillospiraceae bacterium]NLO62197.1 glycoside hydrolase family 5 protein [Clostridiaceae bacterium]